MIDLVFCKENSPQDNVSRKTFSSKSSFPLAVAVGHMYMGPREAGVAGDDGNIHPHVDHMDILDDKLRLEDRSSNVAVEMVPVDDTEHHPNSHYMV